MLAGNFSSETLRHSSLGNYLSLFAESTHYDLGGCVRLR